MRRFTEERSSRRIDVAWPCTVRAGGRGLPGAVGDVHTGGLAIVTCARVQPGDVVEVTVAPPETPPVTVALRVSWTRTCLESARTGRLPGFGGAFVAAPPDALRDAIAAARRRASPELIDDCPHGAEPVLG